MKYAFILGREPALSTAEILASFKAEGIEYDKDSSFFAPEFFVAEVPNKLDLDFFSQLGGSIKLAEVLKESSDLENDLFDALLDLKQPNIDFGVSVYGKGVAARNLALSLKTRLKEAGVSARAVLGKNGPLTSVQVDKNKLIEKGAEMLVIKVGGRTLIAKTVVVQAFEAFSDRDYGRPGRDAKSGMLPPKLARMMINLALAPKDELLLDPFCGSGTILTEAVLMGHQQVFGSDISDKAIEDTKKNHEWTIKEAGLRGIRFKAIKRDVKTLPEKMEAGSVAAIVTEPYLGPPLRGRESDQQIHRNFLELMELYLGAFKSFAKLLKPGGSVVFVFPFFGNKHVNILRELQEMGFKPEGLLPGKAVQVLGAKSSTGLIYKRSDQRVGRDIFRFRYKPSES